VRKIRPPGEGNQAAVCRWITHSQQQENSECDIELIIIDTAGSREKNNVSGITPAVNNSPTKPITIFSVPDRTILTSFSSSQSVHGSASNNCTLASVCLVVHIDTALVPY
jgi:hypothetical protein